MILVENNFTDVYFNLSMEEYIFQKYKDENIFILWINEPSIILGKHQNLIEEVNTRYCYENNIKIARRISGGGTVYHDFGNLNYTFISNSTGDTTIDFKEFVKPMYKILKDINKNIEISPRNDFVVDGLKFCGHSQYMRNNRVLHHGCILFDSDIVNLKSSIIRKKSNIISKSAKSVRSEVANLKKMSNLNYDIYEFKNILKSNIVKYYKDIKIMNLSNDDINKIEDISIKKYSTKEWIYGQSPNSILFNESEDIRIKIESGKIKSIQSNHDFSIFNELIDKYCSYDEISKFINYHQTEDVKRLDFLTNI